jgi:hypothetical protein
VIKYFYGLFIVLATNLIFAQQPCGTDEFREHLFQINPKIKLENFDLEKDLKNLVPSTATQKAALVTYSIPIVVHVVHDYGAENISNLQIMNAINQLNLDFSGANPDLATVIPQFTAIIGTPSLVFVPARFDPFGNCTNGIDRIVDEQTYNGYSKPNQWPPSQYLNFWVVNNITGGPSGFASFPSAPMNEQGVVVQYNAFNAVSRTPTHEVGHFLNLEHTFQGGCQPTVGCLGNGDNVCDTPPTTTNNGCPSPVNAVNCFGLLSNYQNFMDYTNCGVMFTNGQHTRMFNALTSPIGGRSSLISPTTTAFTGINQPTAVCAPKIDFKPGYQKFICVGDSVRYEDLSYSSAASNRTWSFSGGNPSSSNSPTVWVKYFVSGVYSATLIGSNSGGSSTGFKTNIVSVLPTSAQYSTNFNEDFESAITYSTNWSHFSKQNNIWGLTSVAAYNGTSCVAIQNKTSKNNEVDLLYSTSFNLSALSFPKLSFARSYARIDNSNDRLRVLASKDCGDNWIQIYSKQGAQLATTFSIASNFIPIGTTEWDLDTIDLSPIANEPNVRFAFEIQNDNGNNVYLDEINLFSSLVTENEKIDNSSFNINVFPNPSNGVFKINTPAESTLSIFSVLGQIVYSNELDKGENEIVLNSIDDGVYYIHVSNKHRSFTQKLLIYK